ncbi:hypothetical protein [Catellatospora citrea]|nr:hypothetical protein [Catellatospora citrea]
MTREAGTLLAQIIPVLALALGLELRAFAVRVRADQRESRRGDEDGSQHVGAAIGVFVAVVLAAGEQLAIAAANGIENFTLRETWTVPFAPGSPLLGGALWLSIVAVFLLPAFQAITAMMSPELTKTERSLRQSYWMFGLVLAAVLLPVAM